MRLTYFVEELFKVVRISRFYNSLQQTRYSIVASIMPGDGLTNTSWVNNRE